MNNKEQGSGSIDREEFDLLFKLVNLELEVWLNISRMITSRDKSKMGVLFFDEFNQLQYV